jgi:hypothetical protein
MLCWILSIWEALGWNIPNFGLIHALLIRGDVWACFVLLNAFGGCSGGFEPFLGSVCHRLTGHGHRSDLSEGWSCSHWAPVWPVVSTGLSWADAAALFSSSGLHAFIQEELHWFKGSLHVCRGSSFWFSSFGLVVFPFCFSIVLSRMCCRAVALT